MPARRRYIDPTTKDYVVENGSPRADSTHVSTAVFLLSLRYGSSAVAPELGNRIYDELDKLTDDAPRRAERFAILALRPLTRTRAITELDVEASVEDGTLCLEVAFTDKDGVPQSFPFRVARGA